MAINMTLWMIRVLPLSIVVLLMAPVPACGFVAAQTTEQPSSDVLIPSAQDFAEVAHISGSVYAASSIDSAALSNEGTIPLAFLDRGGVQVAVLLTSDKLYIAFRGTDGENQDFFNNAQLELVEFEETNVNGATAEEELDEDVLVYKGFYEPLFQGTEGLLDLLDDAVLHAVATYPDRDIVTCGHSLGGAQSILYGLYLARTLLENTPIYSWSIGTPRVGNTGFQMACESTSSLSIWRLVNRNDIVARLPLKNTRYTHVGNLLLYSTSTASSGIENGDVVRAYYAQEGDLTQGYRGVPRRDWNIDYSLDNILGPLVHHFWWKYQDMMDRVIRDDGWPVEFEQVVEARKDDCRHFWIICWGGY